MTASNGAGGLSPEIFAANPDIGQLVLLQPTDEQDRYRAELTIPADTPPHRTNLMSARPAKPRPWGNKEGLDYVEEWSSGVLMV